MNEEDEDGNKKLIDVAPGGKVNEDDEDESKNLIAVVSPSELAKCNCEIDIHKNNEQAVQAVEAMNVGVIIS